MRLRAFIYCCAVFLAAVAAQNSLFQYSSAEDSSVSACPEAASGCSSPGNSSPVHSVLADACPGGDLHVMHYEAGSTGAPLVATWCK